MCDNDDEQDLESALISIAHAITPNIMGGTDASGGHVESLTEAMMGISASLRFIGEAIYELADSVKGLNHGKIEQG